MAVASRAWVGVVAAAVVISATAACGPRVISAAARAHPLFGLRAVAIDKVSFDGMRIGNPGDKSEEQWVATKDADERDELRTKIEEMKFSVNREFHLGVADELRAAQASLVEGGGRDTFVIQADVVDFEPGFNAVMVRGPAVIRMDVKIIAPDGGIVERFTITEGATDNSFDFHDRAVECARALGEQAGERVADWIAGYD